VIDKDSRIKFLHPVGTSTYKYGITIPVEVQTSRYLSIDKGQKLSVTLFVDTLPPVTAEIRRLNNRPGHLQFRYENKSHEALRRYLHDTFGAQNKGNLLEVEEVAPLAFHLRPILKSPTLRISELLLHNINNHEVEACAEMVEIEHSLLAIDYVAEFNQSDYNRSINEGLVSRGWQQEQRVVDELGLRCDFEKNGVWVEVEFGNARSYYQDYVKFMLARKYREARLGLLLCPTNVFAGLLCELGSKRAQRDVVRERAPVYSGMMCYEKAVRELPYLGFMFEMPIVVAGVGLAGI
jgi:hypothetical protein